MRLNNTSTTHLAFFAYSLYLALFNLYPDLASAVYWDKPNYLEEL